MEVTPLFFLVATAGKIVYDQWRLSRKVQGRPWTKVRIFPHVLFAGIHLTEETF